MKTLIVSNACRVIGAGHFVTQSAADMLLSFEGSICSKYLGQDKQETMQNRVAKTNDTQQKLVALYAKKMSNLKNK